MSFSKKIADFRASRQMTHQAFADAVGVSRGAVQQWEKGTTGPKRKNQPVVAEFMGITVAELMSDTAKDSSTQLLVYVSASNGPVIAMEPSNIAAAAIGNRRIPLIDYVQAGLWTGITDAYQPGDAYDWLLTDLELSPGAFALEIKGDSMATEFSPGDRIIIDPNVQPQAGDYVVAKNGGEEATFKKYRLRGHDDFGNDVFELIPLNEDYATLRSDLQPIKIVGTMVEHRKYRKKR